MEKLQRIFYIDNLRIFLIALVVLHHLSITYGASGGWYYKEVEGDLFTKLILTMFTASNQSFFMGLFFLISAYFTRISLERKSTGNFIKDRMVRLGIPLIIFYFILSPLTIYLRVRFGDGSDLSFFEFIKQHQGFGFGPMWFVETLIYFSFIYVIIRLIFRIKDNQTSRKWGFPKPAVIILFALGISAVSFTVRLWFRLGSEIPYIGLQLPYFPQYIAMLIVGILYAKYHWFDQITYKQGIRWFAVAQFFILVVFPLFFLFSRLEGEPYAGGWNWQSALLCTWEQITGFSLMIGLTGMLKDKINKQGKLAKSMSGAAYAVFMIHAPVIVFISLSLENWDLYPVLKFIVIAPVALFVCFGIGILLKKIPIVNKII
ncbi:MAG: acyltransferase [Bacteroidetes bacterium]|nr:acyltransferase [Bacteroidota bacterium]